MASFPAHPRSRGENSASGIECDVRYGSSPLTRGKHHRSAQHPPRSRLIPAHAGKTARRAAQARQRAAHPRSRGENFVAAMYALGLRGSSPLTRGKPGVDPQSALDVRLIPAHAGKTGRCAAQAR